MTLAVSTTSRWGLACLVAIGATLAAAPVSAVPIPYRVGPAEPGNDPTMWHLKWDVKNSSTAELTFDFGAESPELPAEMGVPRYVKFPARKQGTAFVVQGTEFDNFVKGIFAKAAQATGMMIGPSRVTRIDLHRVAIRVARNSYNLQLTLEINVTVHGLDDEGRPDSVPFNQSFPITAEPVPMTSEDAGKAMLARFGQYVPSLRKGAIPPARAARYVEPADFHAMLRRVGEDPAANVDTHGFVDRRGTPVAYIRKGAPLYATPHEVTHVYQNPHFRGLGKNINEGLTHAFSTIAFTDPDGNAAYDFNAHYQQPVRAAYMLLRMADLDTVAKAYFGGGTAEIDTLRRKVDQKMGAGEFDRFIQMIQ